MKQVDTEPGSQYSVDSAAGCTVSTPAGQVICRVMPGILDSFQASGYVTCFSDDAAEVQLVSAGTPGGTGGQQLTISQALDAASRSEAAARKAAADAARAESAQAEAEDARDDAEDFRDDAEDFRDDAEAARDAVLGAKATVEDLAADVHQAAAAAAADAEVARGKAEEAESCRAAAEAAQGGAEGAQRVAEEKAAETVAAAEAVLQPESVAVQAARPATMVLLKDELLAMLGDASLFDIDTDGQKIIVHTDRLDDALLAAVDDMLGRFVPQFIEVERYNHTMEISWRDINKYAECVTPMDMYAVSPETTSIEPKNYNSALHYFTTDYLSDGSWPWPLPKLETVKCGMHSVAVFELYALPEFCISLPSLKEWTGMPSIDRTWKTKRVIINAPNVTKAYGMWGTVIRYFYITSENVTDFYDNTWSANLTQVDFELPKLNKGNSAFNKAALNKESTLRILNSIPSYTSGDHKITIGIHIDHQTDDEVLAVIAEAENKGWTLTVQWNGTPTAQAATTYGLRKPPIYARVSELENGERFLDWGHYVTDATGYEEFRSVEAAREYFGLPEEDLTETE